MDAITRGAALAPSMSQQRVEAEKIVHLGYYDNGQPYV
jgi:hypothetical protein